MDVSQQERSSSFLHHTVTGALHHPVQALIVLVFVVAVATRVVTGLQYRAAVSNQPQANSPRTVPILPYWIPWIGHGISFAAGGTTFLSAAARSLGGNGSVYALWMANSKHNVVTVPSLAKQILMDRSSPITMEDLIYHVMKTFWGDGGAIRAIDPAHLWGNIHGVLSGMLRESFVTTAIKVTVDMVQERTWNMISGAVSPVDQSIWERQGNVEIVSKGKSDGDFVAEASLMPLIRYFVGDIATTVLFGKDFMENNPNIMPDLWQMDTRFNLFLTGAPSWFPGMAGPAKARERIVRAIDEHHQALFKYLDGQDPGPRWSDMSDVSSVMVDRARAFRAAGSSPRGWATGNGALLWTMNINSNAVIFWMVWYVFSTPSLLQEIRREIAPYVRLRQPAATGLPIEEQPKLEIDVAALWAKCPLLKGAFFEAMRLEAPSMSYKMVEDDFVVYEDEKDARNLGKKEPQSWLLKKGELICIPHGVHQSDEKYFRDPDRFDPRRFWAKESQATEKGENGHVNGAAEEEAEVRVEYKTMKVWGGGKQMCKGKTFAEREVVLFGAAIIMQWDIEPVDNGGKWVHPGRIVGAGAMNPKRDVRVRMRRREGW
ncbi:cytochrome P450 monooxygenase [Cladophialophora carrionii]|uniref:Cytochrome P450 monooxygenase n=1 Tax=Cladophialophora carrionii TaxID=86049 RepID=A0A1C1CV70_9EURO|nr:cytochrome P450 monooxygenase [Cladophialophora carrionii]